MNLIKLCNTPFWVLSTALVVGVFVGKFVVVPLDGILAGISFLLIGLYVFRNSNTALFMGLSNLLFLGLGVARHQLTLPSNQHNHITTYKELDVGKEVIFTITEWFKDSKKYKNYKATIQYISGEKVEGNFLLKVKKDTNRNLYLGGTYTGYVRFYEIHTDAFSYGFNYNKYLQDQDITHKVYVEENSIIELPALVNKIKYSLGQLQLQIDKSLEELKLDTKVLQFTKALILGDRRGLDKGLQANFSKAGVMHILAISGLHIGMVYALLLWVFNRGLYKYKFRVLKSTSVILLLWLFVGFTGASDSALRAVTMFTCLEIGRLLLRRQHPLNVLFLSVFILVLITPKIIFSAGFQLSITAVASIILGMRLWLNLWKPSNRLILVLWSITGVSLCAQIGLLPLSIYYFHQFPGLFLVANIPIMCVVPVVMIVAVVIVVGGYLGILSDVIVRIYNYSITGLISFVNWVASQDVFIFKQLYISAFSVLGFYLVLGYLLWWCHYKKAGIKYVSLLLLGGICFGFAEINQSAVKQELWLLDNYKNTIMVEVVSGNVTVWSSKQLSVFDKQYKIVPLVESLHIDTINYCELEEAYNYDKEKIVLINQDFIPNIDLGNKILIVSNTPKINMERLLQNNRPKQLVFAANNYKDIVVKWKATCNVLGVAYYDVAKKGSIRLDGIE